MNAKRTAFFLLLSVFSASVSAQDLSNKGKDFWVAYAGHIDGTNSRMALYITSDQNATGTVDINGNSASFSVVANQVSIVQITNSSLLNNSLAYNPQVEGVGIKKGIHILSDKPVVVYAHILNAARSGSSLVLPTNVLGKEYYVSSYKSTTSGSVRRSQFEVIATVDNTTVQITPTNADANGLHPANVPFLVTLSKGDVYQYQSDEDLTGTYIKSIGIPGAPCQPIAVFSGSSFASMGCPGAGSGDNLYQQLFPFGAWGKVYYTAPFISRAYDIFRILVQDINEPVYVNGNALNPATLIAGRFYEYSTQGNNIPNIISSGKPICVFQYMITQGCDGVNSDPEMVILNPIEQTLNDITVLSARRDLTPPNTNITSHYLNIIFKSTSFNSLKIDGIAPTAIPRLIPGTAYSYIQQDVTSSTINNPAHRIVSDSGFICIAYGYGNVESYGYNAGTNVKDLYQFVSIQNEYGTIDFPSTCRNTPFNFSMTFPYQPTAIKWLLSSIGYQDITVNAPAFDSSYVVNGKTLYRYKLSNSYSISSAGTYQVKVLAQNPTPDGCSGEQEINYDLQVYERPTAGFSYNTNGCVSDAVNFTDVSAGNSRPIVKWSWNFGDNNTAATKNPAHAFTAVGDFKVRMFGISDIGCLSDTTEKTVSLSDKPTAVFNLTPPLCVNTPITFSDQSASPGSVITKWYREFGDGSVPDTAYSKATWSHTYNAAGTYTTSLKVETVTGCQSAVASNTIIIHPRPVAAFTFGNACLPAGSMPFVNSSSLAGGSQNDLTSYWTFGDGGSSGVLHPVHNYTSTGPFDVVLMVTSTAGCMDTATQQNNKVFAQPVADISVSNQNACLDYNFIFDHSASALNSTITEHFWNFGDDSSSTLKQPVKKFSVPGDYEVKFYVKSATGCSSDTARKKIKVYALPSSRFTIPSTTCETKDIQFVDLSTSKDGNLVKWKWNMGIGGPDTTRNTNGNFTYVYPSAAPYRVTLITESDRGCVSPVFDTVINVHAQPLPGFLMSANCLKDPFSSFTDTSTVAGDIIISRLWNFGDPYAAGNNANSSSQKSPVHKYFQATTYNVSLTVASANGCIASVVQPFTINGSVPQSNFSVDGGSALCSNDTVRITDNSFADVGRIVKLEIFWDFANDPAVSTTVYNPAPGKKYAFKYPEFFAPTSRPYTIRVVAYSGDNCFKDAVTDIQLKNTPDILLAPLPAICGNAASFLLASASVNNNTGGSGMYSGPGTTTNSRFNPSIAGAGIHTIRYTHSGANGCINSKEQQIKVYPVPLVNAGPDKIILEGGSERITGSGSGGNISYLWSPGRWLNSDSIPDPVTSATDDITYTLQVTSSDGCVATDEMQVKVLKAPSIPNAFSPNGDGINDYWEIKHLSTYPAATVAVYNRYGQFVFQSKGYGKPWDGTLNGKGVPAGTYYYIVNPGNGRKQMSGYLYLVR